MGSVDVNCQPKQAVKDERDEKGMSQSTSATHASASPKSVRSPHSNGLFFANSKRDALK